MKAFALLSLALMLLVIPLSMACTGPGPAAYAVNADSIRAKHQALFDIAAKAGGLDAGIRLNETGTGRQVYHGWIRNSAQNVRFEESAAAWWPENYDLSVWQTLAVPTKSLRLPAVVPGLITASLK
jgi:hypothetical protein